jgi:ribonuclease-3
MWRYLRRLLQKKPDRALAEGIKRRLGYLPCRLDLYRSALTHGSILRNTTTINRNERLEFLGDAVIEMVVSHYLYTTFGNRREGFLTQMRSRLVSRQHLAELASHLDLPPLLVTYHVNVTKNILGNAFEALVGAMYLDIGYDRTRECFIENVLKKYVDIDKLQYQTADFKSRLLEVVQHRPKWEATFDTTERRAKRGEHDFHCVLRINDTKYGDGSGTTKKEAEQNASQKALEELGYKT